MAVVCRNSYGLDPAGTQKLFDEAMENIDSFDEVIKRQNDPIDRFDRKDIEDCRKILNEIGNSPIVNKEKYPNVFDRSKVGDFTFEEIASFFDEYEKDPFEFVNETENMLPPQFPDTKKGEPVVFDSEELGNVVNVDSGNSDNNSLNKNPFTAPTIIVDNTDTIYYPTNSVGEVDFDSIKVYMSRPFNSSDGNIERSPLVITKFDMKQFNTSSIPQFGTRGVYVPNPVITQTLTQLDYFLGTNVSSAVSGDFCSAFGAALSAIVGLVNLGVGIGKKIGDLTNLKGTTALLSSAKEKMFSIIDNMKKKLTGTIDRILDDVSSFGSNIAKIALKKYNSIKDMFSEEGIKKLKESVEGTVAKMAGAIEELDIKKIGALLFRMCQIMQSISNLFQNPVDQFSSFKSSIYNINIAIASNYDASRAATVSNGGFRPSVDEIRQQKEIAYGNLRGGVGQEPRFGGNTSPTPAVIKPYDGPMLVGANKWEVTRDGGRFIRVENQYFTLTDRAMNVGVDFNFRSMKPDTCGWTELSPELLAKAAQLSERLGTKLTISSAYRTPEKNESVGGAKNSFHMKGVAADILTMGINTANFVKQASLVGITGIGYYNSFIHIDVRPGRSMWVSGSPNNATRDNLNIHKYPERYGYFRDT